ncbi:50S ribosomal protein L6 [Candidatus Peregrinibacteria bacterium]|nr:50S ribosomal protein L6 [Candidatus Peregrinibacteria bacterium]
MSLIGKRPIIVPASAEVTIAGRTVKVKGPKGELSYTFSPLVDILMEEGQIIVKRKADDKQSKSTHGLTRALLNNMVIGVSEGFEKRLEIIGVGYRAQVSGKKITLSLGFSHPIEMIAPEGVNIAMDPENKNVVIISGIDKQQVGEMAAQIRKHRPPEPYKGKGVRYIDEHVHRKAGKAAAKASA